MVTFGWLELVTMKGIPYGTEVPESPKSGWMSRVVPPLLVIHAPLYESTGRPEISVFHALSAGKTGHPAITGPDPAEAGGPVVGACTRGRWVVGTGLIVGELGTAAEDGWLVATGKGAEVDVCSTGWVVDIGEVVVVGDTRLTFWCSDSPRAFPHEALEIRAIPTATTNGLDLDPFTCANLQANYRRRPPSSLSEAARE
jgi:hypothetical protein